MLFVTIKDGAIHLHANIRDDAPVAIFSATAEGGIAFKTVVGDRSVICSSSVDFSDEYGVAPAILAEHFGL